MSPAGRRPGPTTTAGEILAAARALFAEAGYQATTLRAVAERAGVNQALIRHFYGTKQQLFLATLAFPEEVLTTMFSALSETPRARLGEQIVRAFLRLWRSPETSQQLQAFFRAAAGTEEGATMARELAERVLLPQVSAILAVEPATVAAIVAQLLGFAFLSEIVKATPLASSPEDEVVALLGPAVQRYLDAPHRPASS